MEIYYQVETLKNLGLKENEAKAYLTLLTLQEATASKLAKEMKIERRTAYDLLQRLSKLGLVGWIEKERKTFYRASTPLKLLEILEERENSIKKIREKLIKILPTLQTISERKEKLTAQILFGKEGIKTIYNDELKEKKPVYVICTSIDRTEDLLKHFLIQFTKKRIKSGIKIKMLSVKSQEKILKKYMLLEVKYLPEEYLSPASLTIYSNKLAIHLWSEEPITVWIENEEVVKQFLKYFELMWKIAK